MTKYAWLLLSLHSLYILYMFAVHNLMDIQAKDEKLKLLAEDFLGLIKLNCFIYIGWLPLYLHAIGYG